MQKHHLLKIVTNLRSLPHAKPNLLVSVTDERKSFLFDDFQNKVKITAPYCPYYALRRKSSWREFFFAPAKAGQDDDQTI